MSASPLAPIETEARYDIEALVAAIGDVPVERDPSLVRRRSRDFFWYSPILNRQLHGKAADIIVIPRDEADVVAVLAACYRLDIPVTTRAGGTGNYGQAVPLEGGVLLDVSGLNAVEWVKPGMVRVGAGARMHELDATLRAEGWELRMHPSTKRMATIGGFIAGGSGGIGSVTWGVLRDAGNLVAARVVTMEAEPRVLELRGRDVQAINHGYGTTGIITMLEVPTAPARDWIELVVTFDDFLEAVSFGHELALADGIVKKLVTPIDAPITPYLVGIAEFCPPGQSIVIAMVAESAVESFRTLLAGRGTITCERPSSDAPGQEPLYEYTWNHTTLQWLKQDRGVTYLQCLFPADRLREAVTEMRELFGDEVLYHLEFVRFGGKLTCSALPIVRFTTEERLNEIIAIHEAHGIFIANPHVWTLEDGSRHKKPDSDQLGFKHQVDPRGLLNPGKMRFFVPA